MEKVQMEKVECIDGIKFRSKDISLYQTILSHADCDRMIEEHEDWKVLDGEPSIQIDTYQDDLGNDFVAIVCTRCEVTIIECDGNPLKIRSE